MAISPANVVCGVKPEWTNFLLQCTAAAAWPSECSVMRPSSPAPPVLAASEVATQEAQLPFQAAEPPFIEQPIDSIGLEINATSNAQVPAALVEQAPLVIEPEITVEQAREIAAGMDFRTTLSQFQTAHQEFTTTAADFPMPLSQPEAWEEPRHEPEDIEAEDPEIEPVEGESAARAPLKQAAARTAYINEEVRRAEELLNQIEEGYDRREEQFKSKKAQLEEKLRREQEEVEAQQREAIESEEAAAREAQRLREEKVARKAARKAEKERLAAEEAAKPVYPVSKYSADHGARLVSCVGDDDEYAWDGDEDNEEAKGDQSEVVQESIQMPLEGAAAFDLSSALVDDPNAPIDKFGGHFAPDAGACLFEKLKAQLKETYVSYLCASMPETLLKQYKPGELVACLQFLLAELRRNIAQHGFDDVGDEEPTSIAEEIRGKFPSDWLSYLQDGTPSVFCQQYDVPELIDTLQSLSQTCLERLEDNLGRLQSWLEESSPLRYIPQPVVVEVETPKGEREDGFAMTNNSGGFTSELAPAPWEELAPAPAVAVTNRAPAYGGGFAATVSDFRRRVPSPTPVTSHVPTVFDSTLGPAIWEQSAVSYPASSLSTQAPRYAATAIGGRGVRTAVPHHVGGPPHPGTSTDYRGRPMTHLGGPIIASR